MAGITCQVLGAGDVSVAAARAAAGGSARRARARGTVQAWEGVCDNISEAATNIDRYRSNDENMSLVAVSGREVNID